MGPYRHLIQLRLSDLSFASSCLVPSDPQRTFAPEPDSRHHTKSAAHRHPRRRCPQVTSRWRRERRALNRTAQQQQQQQQQQQHQQALLQQAGFWY